MTDHSTVSAARVVSTTPSSRLASLTNRRCYLSISMLEIVLCVVALLGSCTPSDIIVTNNEECTQIGRSLFERSATVEQTYIAVSLCEGLVHPMDSGIGGGFQAIIHNARPQQKRGSRHVYLMSREYSPMDKSFRLEPFIFGNSVGVPAVLAGYARLLGVNQCIYTSRNNLRKTRSAIRRKSSSTTESSMQIDYRERQSNLNRSALNKRSQSTYSYNRECVNKIQTGQTGSGFSSNLRGIPYKEIFEPVIRLASRGFVVSPTLGSILNESTHLPFFIKKLQNGKATNYRLAVFMQHLSFNPLRLLDPYVKWNNRDVHSLHDIRSIMLNDVRHHGSKLTQRDFRSYRAEVRAPLTVRFSLRNVDYDLITLPSPGGGESIAFFAKMLEELLAKGAHKTLSPVQKSVMFLFLSKYTYAAKAYFRQISAEQKRRMLVIESKKIVRELYKDIRMRPSESSLVDYWLHSIQPIPNVFGGTEFPVIKVAVKGERTRADATGLNDDEVDRETLMDLVENDDEADEDTEAEIGDVEPESCGKTDKCALDETDESYDFTSETSTEEPVTEASQPATSTEAVTSNPRKRPVTTEPPQTSNPRKRPATTEHEEASPRKRPNVTSIEPSEKEDEKEKEPPRKRPVVDPEKEEVTTSLRKEAASPRKRPTSTEKEEEKEPKEGSPRKRPVTSTEKEEEEKEPKEGSPRKRPVTSTEKEEEKEPKEGSPRKRPAISTEPKRPNVTSTEPSDVEKEAKQPFSPRKHTNSRKRPNVTLTDEASEIDSDESRRRTSKRLKNADEAADEAENADAKHHQHQKREEPLKDFLKADEEEVKDEPLHSRRSHTTTEKHLSLHSLATNMSHVHHSTLRVHPSRHPHTTNDDDEKVTHRLHTIDKNEGEKIEEKEEDYDYSTQTQKPTLKPTPKPTLKPSTQKPHPHHVHPTHPTHRHVTNHPADTHHEHHHTSNQNHSHGSHHAYSSQIQDHPHRGRDRDHDDGVTHAHHSPHAHSHHEHHETHDLRPNLTLLLNERERSSRTTNLQASNSSNANSTTSLRLKKYVGVVYESSSVLGKHNSTSLDKAVIDAFRIAGQRKGVLDVLSHPEQPDKAVLRLVRDTPQPQDPLSSETLPEAGNAVKPLNLSKLFEAGKFDTVKPSKPFVKMHKLSESRESNTLNLSISEAGKFDTVKPSKPSKMHKLSESGESNTSSEAGNTVKPSKPSVKMTMMNQSDAAVNPSKPAGKSDAVKPSKMDTLNLSEAGASDAITLNEAGESDAVKPSVKIRNIRHRHRAKYAGKLDESYEHLTLALRDIDRVEQPHNPNQFTNQPRDTEFDLDDLESRRRENKRDKKVSLLCESMRCSVRDLEYDLDDLYLARRDRRGAASAYEDTQGYSETPWGTTNVVIKTGNRSIVATSSINHSFGSLIFSQHLGIPYNNVLRDFTPYTWYQVDQTHPREKRKAKSLGKGVLFRNSKTANRTRKNISSGIKLFANRPLPHSIPQSNMGCTILSNRVTRNPVFGIGAAGGFKITSAIINTMWNYFFLGESLEEAISKLRITTKLNYKTRMTEIWYEFPSQSSYQKDLTERYGLVYTGPSYKELMFAPENVTSTNDTQMMGRVAHSPQFFYKYRDDLQVKYISEAGYSAATAFTTMRDLKPRGSSDPRRGGSTYVK